jgi:predicted oxidoreductase
LRRLQTNRISLVQHHEVIRFEDPHRIFDAEGANAALVEARAAGKIRYIGFTGHKDPRIHLHMLEVANENGFAFDTVQMPLNVMDAHHRSFEQLVLPELTMEILDQALDVARKLRPTSAADRQALLSKTKATASDGEFELFKTGSIFDSTATNPGWLGEEPQRVRKMMPA